MLFIILTYNQSCLIFLVKEIILIVTNLKGGNYYATNKMDSLEGDGSFTEPLQ